MKPTDPSPPGKPITKYDIPVDILQNLFSRKKICPAGECRKIDFKIVPENLRNQLYKEKNSVIQIEENVKEHVAAIPKPKLAIYQVIFHTSVFIASIIILLYSIDQNQNYSISHDFPTVTSWYINAAIALGLMLISAGNLITLAINRKSLVLMSPLSQSFLITMCSSGFFIASDYVKAGDVNTYVCVSAILLVAACIRWVFAAGNLCDHIYENNYSVKKRKCERKRKYQKSSK